jgi:hypothetical protein
MQDEIKQSPDRARESTSATDSAERAPPGSISFVIATGGRGTHVRPLLNTLDLARRSDDEVILLANEDYVHTFTHRPPWLRIVAIPDASVFHLRSHVPAVCRKEWVVVLEDHSLVDTSNVEAIRRLIRERPTIDMIPFLAKNLTETKPWEWAVFLHTFALLWAPLDHPPPFAAVTSAIIRRTAFGTDAPLKDGEWELRTLPRIFSTGKHEYSNDIFIDHVKPGNIIPSVAVVFHNARACAVLQRRLGASVLALIMEGLHTFGPRPGMLMQAIEPRRHELPAGMRFRLHALGFAQLVGYLTAILFGAGRSAYKVD